MPSSARAGIRNSRNKETVSRMVRTAGPRKEAVDMRRSLADRRAFARRADVLVAQIGSIRARPLSQSPGPAGNENPFVHGYDPSLREGGLIELEVFQFLPVQVELDFSGSGLQLAQAGQPQELSRCPDDRFGIVVEACDLLQGSKFLGGDVDRNAHN